ncbi:MAG: efflux RND transporter periplasmic adaptor subunit [Hahellaceae bacterium]|nr:efflux RND transporter periplasmic adaptor subunit [Hahellaceae bacterium]
MFKTLLPLIVLVASLGAAYTLFIQPPEMSHHEAVTAPPMTVKTQTVALQTLQPTIAAFGVLQARHEVNLIAQVGGQAVRVSPRFRRGAFVRKGDELLQIDPADYRIQIRVVEGQLAEARAALQEEQGRVQQARQDWSKVGGAAAASALALREPQLAAAQANVNAAEAQLELANLNASRTLLKAPFDGLILEADIDSGQVIAVGAALGRIVATATADVRLAVKASDLAYLRVPVLGDAPVAVTFINRLGQPEQFWTGRITGSEGGVDRETQQLTLIGEITEPFRAKEGLRPLKVGQYLQARIEGVVQRDVILVPGVAVYQNSYVYLLSDGRLQRRSVETGWQGPDQVQIRQGLNPGDTLVITPLGQVGSGTAAVADSETDLRGGDRHD